MELKQSTQTISTILNSLDTAGKWNYRDGTLGDANCISNHGVIQLTMIEQDAELARYSEIRCEETAPHVGNTSKQPTYNILSGAEEQEFCEIQRGGWCRIHNCQAKKSYKLSAPKWSRNSSGLYNNVRTKSTVWSCPNLRNSSKILKASQTSSR